MKTLQFVKHMEGVSTKKGTPKPYNFVELSDGRKSFTINVSKTADIDFSSFTEGDEVTPEVEVYGNRDGYAGVSLVGLS